MAELVSAHDSANGLADTNGLAGTFIVPPDFMRMSLEEALGCSDELDPEGHIIPSYCGHGAITIDPCCICKNPGKSWLPITISIVYFNCNSSECIDKIKAMAEIEYKKNYAYGPLYYLKNAPSIKIRRSNGTIEDDWSIFRGTTGIIMISNLGPCIKCIQDITTLTKYVQVSVILELNPNVN
jgi:hypothetical protein